jgi:hypothetical protein
MDNLEEPGDQVELVLRLNGFIFDAGLLGRGGNIQHFICRPEMSQRRRLGAEDRQRREADGRGGQGLPDPILMHALDQAQAISGIVVDQCVDQAMVSRAQQDEVVIPVDVIDAGARSRSRRGRADDVAFLADYGQPAPDVALPHKHRPASRAAVPGSRPQDLPISVSDRHADQDPTIGAYHYPANVRATDFWIEDKSGGATLDLDLVRRLRAGPVVEYTDVEAAIALAQLLREQFTIYGTSGGPDLTNDASREAMRTLAALTRRLGAAWKPDWRDFDSFHAYWGTHGGHGSWAARRTMVSELFDPLIEALEEREDAMLSGELVTPVSPHGRTGWEKVDVEIAELRRHFHTAQSPQDYRNIGNDLVTVLEALSEAAYDRGRHLFKSETEPPVAQTKNRLTRIIEVDGAGEGSDELVKLGKVTVELAQAVKHNPSGSRTRAGIAADAVIQLVNMVRRLQT